MIDVLLRTTAFTTIASLLAICFLSALRIRSPRIHRIVWALVLVNGWLFFPLAVFQIPVKPVSSPPVAHIVASPIEGAAVDPSLAYTIDSTTRPISRFPSEICFIAFWFGGATILLTVGALRYRSVVIKLPLGRTPSKEWTAEWEEVARRFPLQQPTEFRITDETGPLCCFVPFFYLILAPERLWGELETQQRKAILSHELGHVIRRDLWKSFAIRLLALPQWFNPLAWHAVRAFDEAAEWACDDLVRRTNHESTEASYAEALICIAQTRLQSLPGSAAARGGRLSKRIQRLLQNDIKEDTVMKKLILLGLFVGLMTMNSIRVESYAAETETPAPAIKDQPAPSEQRRQDLERTGMRPYRVEAPDVLSIEFSSDANKLEASSADSAPSNGKYLVGPEGTLVLGSYGKIPATGMTIEEIQTTVEKTLRKHQDPRKAVVKVAVYNSKVFYVLLDNKDKGDTVYRFPVTGNETVLDGLAQLKGLEEVSKKRIWVSRPKDGKLIEMKVDWKAITEGGQTETNYQLLPGDRLFVSENQTGAEVMPTRTPQTPPPILPSPYYESTATIRLSPKKTPPNANQVKLQITILSDQNDNLKEYKAFEKGNAMIIDREQIQTTIRILTKNQLVRTIAAPEIRCRSKDNATIQFEGIRIDVKPEINADGGVLLKAGLKQTDDENTSIDVEVQALVPDQKTLLLQACSEDGIYVAVTPVAVR